MKLEQQVERYKRNLAINLQSAAYVVENEMHDLVARKSGALDEAITTDPVIERKSVLSVDVGPDPVGYEYFVEMGVGGKVYRYHRDGKVVYVGVGQRFMTRALENTKLQVFNIIASTRK